MVGLEGDPKGKLRDEEVLRAFRTQAHFRKSPAGRQLQGQDVTLPDDDEYPSPSASYRRKTSDQATTKVGTLPPPALTLMTELREARVTAPTSAPAT